jgi:tetratricopeptide (TPR) repeat protein
LRRTTTIRLLILLTGPVCAEAGIELLPVPVQALGREPSVVQLMASAQAALEQGDLESARASLERVLSREAANKQARLALVDVLIRMARWAGAESQARILSSQFPEETEPMYLLAQVSLRRGDPESANEFASRCLERGDNRPEIYKVLALAEYLLKRTEQFEAHIRVVLKKNPRDAEAEYLLARYLYETKQYRQALSAFQEVLEIQPEHYKAHYYAGLVYQMTSDPDRAKAEFLAAIRIIESKQIRYAWPFADLGRQLADAGDLDAAIDWLSQGIHNDPICPKAYYEYARALFHKGPLPEIEKTLIEAVRLDPGYTDAYYLLARYYRKSDKNLAAEQVLARFKDLKAHPVPSPYGLPRQ